MSQEKSVELMDSTKSGITSRETNASGHDLISNETSEIFQLVNYVVICGPISAFGVGANIIILVVFVRQGFKDSMNLSLFALALADLACVISSLWTSICFNPLFRNLDLPFDSLDIMYLTGGFSHQCFSRMTCFITAFITLERCLCISAPLKVKIIITPRRTKVILVFIFLIMIIVFAPFYFVNRLVWRFDSAQNRSILSLTYEENRETVEMVTFFIHSVAMSAVSLLFVLISTLILIINLNKKTKWRQSTAAAQLTSGPETVSNKDRRVVKMIAFISTIFIMCFLPASVIFFMMAYDPEFSFSGSYQNIFFVVWSFAYVLATINSSVNIFVYFNMSSKFRTMLLHTFCRSDG